MELVLDQQKWNALVAAADGSFLQSWEWGTLQESLGRRVWRLASAGLLASVIRHRLPFGKGYLYSPYGPIVRNAANPAPLDAFAKEILLIASKPDTPLFLRIEPIGNQGAAEGDLPRRFGFRKTDAIQPKTTLVLYLTRSEEELLHDMEHDTRYAVRVAERRGVTVSVLSTRGEKEKNFEQFWRLFEQTNRRHNLRMYPKEYYFRVFLLDGDCRSSVFFAERDGELLSAALIVFWAGRATYLYAASAAGYGKLNAPTLTVWRAITEAKRNGCRMFDLWGVSHEKHNWRGITAFKKSFGGTEASYGGAWDYVFEPGWYALYALAKRFTG